MAISPAPGKPEVEPAPSKGGRPRDDSREQAILDAAVELIVDKGYDVMSIEAVATRAGVSKATVYRRWPGKAELVADAIRRMSDNHETELDDTGSLRGDLLALTTTLFANMSGADGGLVCGLAVAVRADAELGRLLAAHKEDQNRQITSEIVSRAVDRGELPPHTDPPRLMEVALGQALFRLMQGEPLDATYADYLVDRILLPILQP